MKLLTKEQKRKIGLVVVPFLGSLIIRFLYLTNKKKFHGPDEIKEDNFILASWHGELLMVPFVYLHYKKNPNLKLMISEHFDGELIAKTFEKFGFGTIRGSSTRSAVKALMQAIKDIKSGTSIGITPDGPKGPRHEVQDGIIAIAQKANVKIVLVDVKPTKFWQLNSWDKFIIPKPFGVINFFVSEPLDVKDLDLEVARDVIKKGLLKHEH